MDDFVTSPRFPAQRHAKPPLLAWLAGTLLAAVLAEPAFAQWDPDEDLLLPDAIGRGDVELRGRYCRQWEEPDGTLVLLFNGAFELRMDARRMSASEAVIWIHPRVADDPESFHVLTVYLSENAEVREAAGTVTRDQALLVTNLRSRGRIFKYHDAHVPSAQRDAPLYQRALHALAEARPESSARPGAITHPEETRPAKPLRPPRRIVFRVAAIQPARTADDELLYVLTGGVYVARLGSATEPAVEIRAENAVVFPSPAFQRGLLPPEEAAPGEPESTQPAPSGEAPTTRTTHDEARRQADAGLVPSLPADQVRAVYLEGDVVLSFGPRTVRADRLYFDFEYDKALILDAVLRADIPGRDVPLYVRADEIRQLSAREFSARDAKVTTSEFHTPHYHIGAEEVKLFDRTRQDARGEAVGPARGTYELHDATLNVAGMPLLYWPYSRGDFEVSETALRRLRTAYSDERGVEIETAWYLFNLLGADVPENYDATLKLNYYSKRGPGLGISSDYEGRDHFGLFRGAYLHDDGEDNLGPLRENAPTTNERGRILWRHRHFLPNDWEVTFETAYISDPNYLESWERSEFHEGKEQETAVYLKRARDTEAITLLTNWRLLDFTTQTEHVPELTYRRIGDTFASPVVLYHESRVGNVRYRPDDRRFFDSNRLDFSGATDNTARADLREEAELPFKVGPLNAVPFVTGRGSIWDGMVHYDGHIGRALGVAGTRGGASFARVYDNVESELFDIHRIRHVVRPDFVAWYAQSNVGAESLTPFDEGLETIDDFYGAAFGLRQTWQTQRGAAEHRRTVDLLRFDLEVGFFGDAQAGELSNGYANPIRPEDSRSRNYVAGDLAYRLSDTTSLLYDFNYDINDNSFDRQNVSLAVERLPRLAYVLGVRHAGDIDMDLAGGGFNYRLNEKHVVSPRFWFDLDSGDLGEFAFAYIRKLPRWYLGVNFEFDRVFDDFTVSLAIWPEGVPEWAIGSRRFTGLATSTGIRP